MNERLRQLLENRKTLYINQIKEWIEIFTDFETRNKYQILDETQAEIGFLAEINNGLFSFFSRNLFGSHRPLEVSIWDHERQPVLNFKRPFFFFFSSFVVRNADGSELGQVKRRFGILNKKYDLLDENEKLFMTVKSPIWRLWTFWLLDLNGKEVGVISKNWGGLLKEVFTDTDRFQIDFPQIDWKKKAVVLATAISIDMDFFEENERRS